MRLFTFVLVVILSAGMQQNATGQASDCEKMVFNTLELIPFEFNERCKTESYPYLSADGLDLYYTNNQTYDWIFYTHRNHKYERWSVPVPIVIANFKKPIRSCTLSDDKQFLFFISGSSLYKSKRIEGSMYEFEAVQEIEIGGGDDFSSEPLAYISFENNGEKMYTYINSKDTISSMGRYRRNGDLSYVFEKYVSATKREMGTLSKNGLTYYYTNDAFPNVLFCRKRKDIKDEFTEEVYCVRQFERHLSIGQVRIAESSNSLVLVLSDLDWNRNDMYFFDMDFSDSVASNFKLFDVIGYRQQSNGSQQKKVFVKDYKAVDPLKSKEIINTKGAELFKIDLGQAFPNPAKNTFYFYYSVSFENGAEEKMPVIQLIDASGRVVYSQVLDQLKGEAKIELDDVPSGSYMIKLECNGVSSEMIRITISL